MKRQKKSGVTISQRVTRSTTTLDRNYLTLPVELVTEIFLRLPSNSIATCRCVCKLWSSILRGQDFTDSFLTRSHAHPKLLFACSDYRREIHFFSSRQPKHPADNSYVVATKKAAVSPSYYELFGCTNGFFCYGAHQGRYKAVFVTVICNPSTGQSLTLPRLIAEEKYKVESYLGYDPIAKEFKVLTVSNGWCMSKEVHVLTLGNSRLSWRLVECCVPHYSLGKWICISGVLYYIATESWSSEESMLVCFDVGTEKFSFVKCGRVLPQSTTLINYNGRLGLLMSSEDTDYVFRLCKSFKLWVLRDAAKDDWSKRVYVLPPLWKDVIVDRMCFAGMVGVNEIVFTPWVQDVPSYVIYYNIKSKTIRKVGIRGMAALRGDSLNTYVNYVENVKLL